MHTWLVLYLTLIWNALCVKYTLFALTIQQLVKAQRSDNVGTVLCVWDYSVYPCFRMLVSSHTSCLTGLRMRSSWQLMESEFKRLQKEMLMYFKIFNDNLLHYNVDSYIFSNPEDKQDNPMVQLFYGTFVAQRVHEGMSKHNFLADDVIFVWYIPEVFDLCNCMQIKPCPLLSSLDNTPFRWMGLTTWMNVWRVRWWKERLNPCIVIKLFLLARRLVFWPKTARLYNIHLIHL